MEPTAGKILDHLPEGQIFNLMEPNQPRLFRDIFPYTKRSAALISTIRYSLWTRPSSRL